MVVGEGRDPVEGAGREKGRSAGSERVEEERWIMGSEGGIGRRRKDHLAPASISQDLER